MNRRRLAIALCFPVLLVVVAAVGFIYTQNVNPPVRFLRLIGLDRPDTAALAARLTAPPGLRVELFADGLGQPRLMAMTSAGDILVSVPRHGTIVRLEADGNGDGRADSVTEVLTGLRRPHGLELTGDTLFIAEEHAVSRVEYDPATGRSMGPPRVIVAGLPSDGGHWSRTLRMGADGWLYLTVGSSCNACVEHHPWRAAMLRFAPDGADLEIFASGLRNTVGFDWHPASGELFGVDNGRDLMGDDAPPDELNRIRGGGFYGWPFYHGDNRPDPDLEDPGDRTTPPPSPPFHEFAAHVAPLSIRFLRHQPEERRNVTALVAHHGSWNRSSRVGYHVAALEWIPDGGVRERVFLEGFRDGEEVFGRPVDVVEGPDGTVYVSDDYSGSVWRITPDR